MNVTYAFFELQLHLEIIVHCDFDLRVTAPSPEYYPFVEAGTSVALSEVVGVTCVR